MKSQKFKNIIKTESALSAAFKQDPLMPPHVILTEGYGNLGYDCGCGKAHGVNDPSIKKIACARPVKVLLKCKSFYTMVRIKGIFSQTAISEWACPIKLVDNVVTKRGL